MKEEKIIEEILNKYSYEKQTSGPEKGFYTNNENEVFHFEINEEGILIRESCDDWFYKELNAEECEKLSNLFKDLSIMLKEE